MSELQTQLLKLMTENSYISTMKLIHRFNNIDSGDLKLILDAFNINILPDLYSKADLKQLKSKINIL